MATASTAINSAVNVRQADVLRICFKEAKYEFLKSLRNPMYSASTLLFPIMFYVLFGLVMGKQMIGGIRTTGKTGGHPGRRFASLLRHGVGDRIFRWADLGARGH